MIMRLFGNMDFFDIKILAGEHVLLKAAAVGAIALVLNDIYHKLCVLEPCIPNDDGIYILNILGDDQRQLTYIEDNLRDLLNVVLLGKIGDGFDH